MTFDEGTDAARFHAPGERADDIKYVGLAISREERDAHHVGIIYRNADVQGGGRKLLHLFWHHYLKAEEVGPEFAWVEPNLEPEAAQLVARLCVVLERKYGHAKRSIAYALRYSDGHFDIRTGDFLSTDGLGLTCATFVMAVFVSHGFPLVRAEEWPPRESDRGWQKHVVMALRKSSSSDKNAQAAAIENEIGCARFRPEEVAASGLAPAVPVGFNYAEPAGAWIAGQLAPE